MGLVGEEYVTGAWERGHTAGGEEAIILEGGGEGSGKKADRNEEGERRGGRCCFAGRGGHNLLLCFQVDNLYCGKMRVD